MCYMLASGKKATTDGSVLVARSCDTPSTMAARFIHHPAEDHPVPSTLHISSMLPGHPGVDIPQVAHTYAYTAAIGIRNEWTYPQVLGGVNEHQLCAGASTGGMVRDEVEALTPWPYTALGDSIPTLVLERCKTAREAVRLAGDLLEKYGARGDNYIFGDKDEAWLLEEYQGYHWAAIRVPDDKYVIMANCFRIAEFDLEDTENCMGSPDLISFAEENGLWPKGKRPFHASLAYGTREMPAPRNYPSGYTGSTLRSHGNQLRVWGGIKTLNPSADIDPLDPAKDYDLFWMPEKKLDVNDFLNVLKCYYQGSGMDEYQDKEGKYAYNIDAETGHYRYAPTWSKVRIVGCPNQSTSWVCKIRGDRPKEYQAAFYAGLGSVTSSPHIPLYACSALIPPEYQKGQFRESNRYEKDSAFWLNTNIGNIKNLFYQPLEKLIRETWAKYEREALCLQQDVEAAAAAVVRKNPERAKALLSEFSFGQAVKAYNIGLKLEEEVFTRLALLNNPHIVLHFQDPDNWILDGLTH